MTAAPAWASRFSGKQYERFKRLVDSFLWQHRITRTPDERGVYDADELSPPLALADLAEPCHALAETEWPVHIARTLKRILAARAAFQQEKARADAAYALPLLRLQLCPAATLLKRAANKPAPLLRPWLPGLAQHLALQLEGRIVGVSQADWEGWGLPATEVFQRALANVKAMGLVATRQHPVKTPQGERGEIVLLVDGPAFMASHALFLSAYVSEAIPYGVLFIVPHDRMVVLHPIREGITLHSAVAHMAAFGLRAHANAPQPLSPHLSWWHEGCFYHLPVAHNEEGMVFSPPTLFIEAVLKPLNAMVPPTA